MKTGWEIKPMGEVGVFQRGGGFLKSDFVENGFPCIHYGQIHMKLGATTYSHLTCIPASVAAKSKIASTGDVIIAITSEDVAGSCKSTAWMGNYDVAIGAHAAIFKHNLNPLFVSYYIQSCYFQRAKEAYTHGFKVVEIKPSDIAKIPIRFPSLPEQQRIVDILDQEFAKIDALKANAEKSLQAAKDLFQATLKKELEPKEGWGIKKAGDIFEMTDFVSNGSFASLRENVEYLDHPDYAVLVRLADYSNGFDSSKFVYVSKQSYDFLAKSKLFGGEIIMSNVGSVGKSFICPDLGCPMTIGPNVVLIRSKNNAFYQYYFQTEEFQKKLLGISSQATLLKFNKTNFKTLDAPVPPTREQDAIVSRLDVLNDKCKYLQKNYQKTLALCDDLKQSLLRKAFNGEL